LTLYLFIYQLTLKRFIAITEKVEDGSFIDHLAAVFQIALRELTHLLFNHRQIVLGQVSRSDDIIIVAVPRVVH
jgi:hypothetical protein